MKNLKKVVAIALAVLALAGALVMFNSCGEKPSEATIDLYMPYAVNLDPAVAYADDASAKLLSLLYEGLTNVSSDGKITKGVAKSWKKYTDRDGQKVIEFKLKNTRWSDGQSVTAENFLDAWERVLNPEFNCQAATLLFPIKNAVAVKNGEMTISDLGISADKRDTLKVVLEDWADYDTFLRNCAATALAPVRKDVIQKIYDRDNEKEKDWSTLVAIIANNGPFYLKSLYFGSVPSKGSGAKDSSHPYMVLERNINYLRDVEEDSGDALDEYVLPYRLRINMTYGNDAFWTDAIEGEKDWWPKGTDSVEMILKRSAQKIAKAEETIKNTLPQDKLDALGSEGITKLATEQVKREIALDMSESYLDAVLEKINDNKAHYYDEYMEENIAYNGALPLDKDVEDLKQKNAMITGSFLFNTQNELFANVKVRQALSLALDREEIAKIIKCGVAADTLVTEGVFETGVKTSFKSNATYGISTKADPKTAKELLTQAGVKGGSFTISVRATDVDIAIAKKAQAAWNALGFDVKILVYGYNVVGHEIKKYEEKNGETIESSELIYDSLLHDMFIDVYNNADFDVLLYDINMLTTDAFPVLAQFASVYSCRAYDNANMSGSTELLPYITGYQNQEYDEIMKKALVETDKAERANLLHQAEEILMKDLPIAPVVYYQNSYVISGDLKGCKDDYFGATQFDKAVYKEKAEAEDVEVETNGAADTTPAPQTTAK